MDDPEERHWWMDVSPHIISPNLRPVQVMYEQGPVDAHVMLCRWCWEVQIHSLDAVKETIRISIVNRGNQDSLLCQVSKEKEVHSGN